MLGAKTCNSTTTTTASECNLAERSITHWQARRAENVIIQGISQNDTILLIRLRLNSHNAHLLCDELKNFSCSGRIIIRGEDKRPRAICASKGNNIQMKSPSSTA
jgi:hypothetical protein